MVIMGLQNFSVDVPQAGGTKRHSAFGKSGKGYLLFCFPFKYCTSANFINLNQIPPGHDVGRSNLLWFDHINVTARRTTAREDIYNLPAWAIGFNHPALILDLGGPTALKFNLPALIFGLHAFNFSQPEWEERKEEKARSRFLPCLACGTRVIVCASTFWRDRVMMLVLSGFCGPVSNTVSCWGLLFSDSADLFVLDPHTQSFWGVVQFLTEQSCSAKNLTKW